MDLRARVLSSSRAAVSACAKTRLAAGLAPVFFAAVFFAAVLLVAFPGRGHAQPMDTYGLGSRAIAMGGAVTADVEDYSANYYNPAGLARGAATRISVGWFGAQPRLQLNGLDSGVDPVDGLTTGLVVPGTIDGFRFAFGIAVHLPDARISRTRSLPRSRPRWELFDNRPQRTFLASHIAIRPFEWLTVGGGIAFLSLSANKLSIRGDIDALVPDRGTRLEHDLNADLTTIRYPQAGIQVDPMPGLSFGLVYRGQFALDSTLQAQVGRPGVDSDTRLHVGDITIPAYFDLLSQSVNAFVPQQLSLGGRWSPTPQFRVNAEVTWVNWSAYVSPIGRSSIILDIAVPPELADTIRVPGTIVGSEPIAANFQDRFVPRVGVEGLASSASNYELLVRGGAFYEHSPVPDQTGLSNLVDTDRLALSAGAGLRLTELRPVLDGWLSFDLHLQWALLPERIARKSSPVDPVGDWRASGHIFGGGLTMEVGFR